MGGELFLPPKWTQTGGARGLPTGSRRCFRLRIRRENKNELDRRGLGVGGGRSISPNRSDPEVGGVDYRTKDISFSSPRGEKKSNLNKNERVAVPAKIFSTERVEGASRSQPREIRMVIGSNRTPRKDNHPDLPRQNKACALRKVFWGGS